MNIMYPDENVLNGYLADLLDSAGEIKSKDYLYLLGSVLADKMLPKLDPTLRYTLICCAEDLDDFGQGFVERIDDVIPLSQMVFWISEVKIPDGNDLPLIQKRYVDLGYDQSHEVIFLRPFILNNLIPRVSILDITDRIKPSKLHLASLFIDDSVIPALESDFKGGIFFESHTFVEVNKKLGERSYIWKQAEKDMYSSLGNRQLPEAIKKKMLVKNR